MKIFLFGIVLEFEILKAGVIDNYHVVVAVTMGVLRKTFNYANFHVLRETQDICPGVLLEVGFLSNREEAEHSMKKESVMGYAMVILQTLYQEIDAENY